MEDGDFNSEWEKYALNEDIKKVIIDYDLIDSIEADISELRGEHMPESLGYFRGATTRDNNYFIFERCSCGSYDGNSINIPSEIPFFKFLEEIYSKTIPNYSTVIYHSHPKITQNILRKLNSKQSKEIIRLAKDEIEQGIYDYFNEEGRNINVDEVLTEIIGRELSENDLKNTPGRYHLLFTDTSSKNNSFSHFNFYDIKEDRKIKVSTPKNKLEENFLEELRYLRKEKTLSKMERFIESCYGCKNQKELEKKALEEGFRGHIIPLYFGPEMEERGKKKLEII